MQNMINGLENTKEAVSAVAQTMRQLGDLGKAEILVEATRIIGSYIRLTQVFGEELGTVGAAPAVLNPTAKAVIRYVIELEREKTSSLEERLREVETIAEFYRREAEKNSKQKSKA